MNRVVVLLFLACVCVCLFAQQQQQTPADKPQDFSGMYSFLHDGEFVQITLEDQNRLTGFISRYGDGDSDRGVFLDHFFKTASTDGTKLSFITEQKHGVWFEFQGTVERGEGKAPTDDAYFVMKGKLTRYTSDADKKVTAESREITMKSFPRDAGMDEPEPAPEPKN